MSLTALVSRLLAVFALFIMLLSTANAEIVLRYTDHEPYGNMRTRAINEIFFAAIEKESSGRIRIDAHWGGELSTSYNALRTIQEGKMADIGIVVPEYTPQQLPLLQMFKSFPTGPDNGDKQVRFFSQVFNEFPEFNAELAHNNLVNLQFFLGYPAAFFSTTPNLTLNALRGTTWRTASFWHQAYLENAGGRVIKMPWDEQITQALRAGTLNGLLVNLDSGDDIKAQQAAKHILFSQRLWLGHVYLLAMNKQRWESLSKEDKTAIQRAGKTTLAALGPTLDHSVNSMVENMRKEGAQVSLLTPDALRSWQEVSRFQQEQDNWLTTLDKNSAVDARRLLPLVASRLEEAMR